MNCPNCSGMGKVTCGYCGGSLPKRLSCSECRGSGKINCAKCNGTGRDSKPPINFPRR